MGSVRIRFQRVQLKAARRWKDGTGKWHQQTKVFEQTINPFNKNEEGLVKSRSEIMTELHLEREAWRANPLNYCKYGPNVSGQHADTCGFCGAAGECGCPHRC